MLKYVNILHGTKNKMRFSNGNVLPITALPHGMTGFCAQTDIAQSPWFFDPDSNGFEGFRLTHQPSPWIGDYGQICICPGTGNYRNSVNGTWSSFRHGDTVLTPYYAKYRLLRYKCDFEVVPTLRGGIFRITFNGKNDERRLHLYTFGNNDEIRVESNRIIGFTNAKSHNEKELKEYFVLEFNCDISFKERVENEFVVELSADKVEIRLATSFISERQSEINLATELLCDFETLLSKAKRAWEEKLSKITVTGGSEEQKKVFYSCLYRFYLFPRIFYEINEKGEKIHITPSGQVKSGVSYTDNGFWDTYRTVYPLLSIIDAEEYAEIVEGFLNYYEDTGYLPKWLSPFDLGGMPGALVEAVIADAAIKGILTKEQIKRAYKGMVKNANVDSGNSIQGRHGVNDYVKYGYLPCEKHHESVNHTLDSAYGDFCIGQVALKLEKYDEAAKWFERSKNYVNLFDTKTKFFRGKKEDGNFVEPFDPMDWGGEYCEGSVYQNGFSVPHDIKGLAQLHGGEEIFLEKVKNIFDLPPEFKVGWYGYEIHEMSEMAAIDFGQCAISNQPSFHIPYIFSALGDRNSTQKAIEKLIFGAFNSSEKGFPGDEDNGTMSAWYIFSSIGFYPFCPGKAEYVLGKCMFDEVDISLSNGRTLRIFPNKDSVVFENTITHEKIMDGGVIRV